MSWPTLGSLMDHFWELDDYQRLRGMRVLDVKLLDLDEDRCNALVRKVTEKKDGRRCTGFPWCFKVNNRWLYVVLTKSNFNYIERKVIPTYNNFQSNLKVEHDMIDNGRRLAAWY